MGHRQPHRKTHARAEHQTGPGGAEIKSSARRKMNGHRFQIEYGASVLKDLDELPARERAQVLRKIERLQSGLQGDIKRLHEAEAMYRLRMGDYRILFDVVGGVIVIRRIGNRKDVYD
jgi:mRNA interferase RelE/StbE